MIDTIVIDIKGWLDYIGSDNTYGGIGVLITCLSLLLPFFLKFISFLIRKFINYNDSWIVKEKEPNYLLDRQLNSLMIEFMRTVIYPFVLAMFNIWVSGFIIGFKEITWRGAVVFVLPVLIYIAYFYIKDVKITYKRKDILYGRLTWLNILCGLNIEIIIEYLFNVKKEIVHIVICLGITIVQLIVNEILIEKAGTKKLHKCHGYKIFETLKMIAVCAEIIVFVAYSLNSKSVILEGVEYTCITCIYAILWIELLVWAYEQRKNFKKNIFLKNSKVKTTFSGIKKGKNATVEWRDGSYTISIKTKDVLKISYVAHLDSIDLGTREITLTDGTNISAYRYRYVLGWCGLCKKCDEGLEVELYPEDDINIRQDENL